MQPNSPQNPEIPAQHDSAQKSPYEEAIMNENWGVMKKHFNEDNVINLLFPFTVAKDTAFHMAVYSKTCDPLEYLLDLAETDPLTQDAYAIKNAFGNTALHLAAMVGNYEAVRLLVNRDQGLIQITNDLGETPLFKAAAYGRTEVVRFLADQTGQMTPDRTSLKRIHSCHRSRKRDSILHATIEGQHFETALELLRLDESLALEEDDWGMTSLQLLANIPSAFKSGYSMGLGTKIFYNCLPVYHDMDDITKTNSKANKTEASSRDTESGVLKGEENQHQVSMKIRFSNLWRSLLKGPVYHNVDNTKEDRKISETQVSSQDIESVSKPICLSNSWKFLFKVSPKMERVWEEKTKHQFALELAKKLVKYDNTWYQSISEDPTSYFKAIVKDKAGAAEGESKPQHSSEKREQTLIPSSAVSTEKIETRRETKPKIPSLAETRESETVIQPEIQLLDETEELVTTTVKAIQHETPLLVATRNGIVEIVYEILGVFPQSVEHYSHKRQNILHVAISHRQKDIFDFVKKMRIPKDRLVGGIDIEGHTILHCAADMKHYTGGTRPGPAYKLQDELKWFKRVEKLVPPHFAMYRDRKGRTAKEFFNEEHKTQHEEAQKWIKETSQSCSTVAVLVATIVFAAAYTVPGGSNERGLPNFLNSPSFLFFTIMDVLSLAGSLTAVVMFLSILTSPFEMHDFRESLPRKLTIGLTLLFLSVATTTLAFTATVLLLIRLASRRKTSTLVYTAAFVPVGILAMTQFPLYLAFVELFLSISKFIKKNSTRKLARRLFQ